MQAGKVSHDRCPSQAKLVYERGFCVLESVFDEDRRTNSASVLRDVWARRGSPPLTGFGFGIHPLFEHAPQIAAF